MTAVLPSAEPRTREELRAEIARLARERNAVILAHYYQEADIQDAAHHVGDSLQLAQAAAKTDAAVIAFAGVHFMAETAKILNPKKTVVVPDLEAGCSLDESAPAADFEKWVKAHPGHAVISYINCSAAVKALSDVICTSSNAEKVVRSIPQDTPILFAPDQHLGAWLVRKTGRPMTLWPGRCMVHDAFDVASLQALIDAHPDALVIAHPECPPDVLAEADYVGSTAGMIAHVGRHLPPRVVMVTECSMSDNVAVEFPGVEFVRPCNLCPHMKRITLPKILRSLERMEHRVEVEGAVAARARRAVERMLEVGTRPLVGVQ